MRFAVRIAFVLLLTVPLTAATPRLSFQRVVPAPHSLGTAEDVVIIYTLGDSEKMQTFLDVLLEETSRSPLRLSDASRHTQHFMRDRADEPTIRELHRNHPADVYLGVKAFTCREEAAGGEGSQHDPDGKRVRRRLVWSNAVCEARVDIIDAREVRRLSSFQVRGEGKSSRVFDLTIDEREEALEDAARRAAINAAENITPRRIRETIILDDTAPLFEEGMAMIDASRLEEARAIWQRGLRQHPSSAALHFNIAAVSEALGDVQAARDHFVEARKMAPEQSRYRYELEMFRRRNLLRP